MFKIQIVWPTIVFPLLWEKYNVRRMSRPAWLLGSLRPCFALSHLYVNELRWPYSLRCLGHSRFYYDKWGR